MSQTQPTEEPVMTQPLVWIATPAGKSANLQGLSESDVIARRAQGLGNDVAFKTSRTLGQILRDNLFTFFNMVLVILGVLLVVFGAAVEAFITSGVLLINVVVASLQEVRAKKKLDHIALLTRPKATVIRASQEQEVDPSEIVCGDLVVVEPGDQIVVDGRVVSQGHLDVDESLLTGESRLVAKHPGDDVQSGSYCVTGRGVYEATEVGANSYANRLTVEARTFTRHLTPLQREVNLVIRVLLGLAAFFGILLIINNILSDVTTLESIRQASVLFGLAPSSLFLMIVVAYAVGAVRIANKGALVQQANSIESLCNVDILCLDKTGTLTTNRLKLDEIHPYSQPDIGLTKERLPQLLGDFCRSATVQNRTSAAILKAYPGQAREVREEVPFSSQLGWSAVVLVEDDGPATYILGAPEILRPHLIVGYDLGQKIDEWRSQGWRVLLFAVHPGVESLYDENDEPRLPVGLIPLCLLNFSDELRPGVCETLQGFAAAGIQLKFISGDNPDTVAALVRQAGLVTEEQSISTASGLELAEMDEAGFVATVARTTVFGRITPRQKEQIIVCLGEQGHYVAMTGDGVNDVLALKRANLGIAMCDGSQATRNVADMVLLDNSFSILPKAFLEGQRIMSGMEDILRLYLTRILYLGVLIAAIGFVGAGFPFTPRQNAIISVITLSIPCLCLALWARPNPVIRVSLVRKLAHFVMPAVITVAVVGIGIYLFFLLRTGDIFYAQTMLTYTVITCGILLIIFVEPPTKWWVGGDSLSGDWRPTILAVGLLVLFAVFLAVPFLRDFYGLIVLRSWTHYLVIGLAAAIWIISVRIVWRANLVERYLNVDLGRSKGAN
jgi:cation-transporting ATPase E